MRPVFSQRQKGVYVEPFERCGLIYYFPCSYQCFKRIIQSELKQCQFIDVYKDTTSIKGHKDIKALQVVYSIF